ncbi:hypothetical protein [Aureispira sp. CCB-QB1]|uniref:hypothetical protein n=1 Tax=Aureispira sp. CCB-QB1 TaxID=1313421 RepID=UPI0012DCF017|nr:hypothetical protein [Aureispira sp. CCB-QB1]
MKNSNLKKALASLSINEEIEVINPETVKGGVGCNSFRCRTYSKPPTLKAGLSPKV